MVKMRSVEYLNQLMEEKIGKKYYLKVRKQEP
jgi:hypothetical protein